jgi:predicted phage-related endonuclease
MSARDFAPQGSPIWLRERVGCLTASRMVDAMAINKSGKPSEARKKLLIEIVAERMADAAVERVVTTAMTWGIEHEAEAVGAYEAATGELTEETGFWLHRQIEHFGASPDRLLGNDGLIEVKCPSTVRFVEWCAAGVVPPEHQPQMLAQLAVTGRRFVDFVAYDPRVKRRSPLFVRRFEPSADEVQHCENVAREFLREADELFTKVAEGG